MGDAHPQDGSQLLLQQPKSNVLHKPSPLNISPDQLQVCVRVYAPVPVLTCVHAFVRAPTGKDAQTIFSPGVETPGHKLPFHLGYRPIVVMKTCPINRISNSSTRLKCWTFQCC
eukprot:1052977-Pelagomonas_calceolata.AAC.1